MSTTSAGCHSAQTGCSVHRSGRLAVGAIAGLFAVSCAACLPGTPGTDAGTVPLAPFERYLEAWCGTLEACAASHGLVYPNGRVCQDFMRALVNCGVPYRDGDGGDLVRVRFEWQGREDVDACMAWLQSASCDDRLDRDPPVCRDLFQFAGGLPAGAACGRFEDSCQVGLACIRPDADPQTCQVCQPLAGDGASCRVDAAACADGLYCAAATQRCTPLAETQQPCSDHDHCRSGWCSGGMCRAPLARDAACAGSDHCAGRLACIGGRCTDRGGEAATCADSSECLNGLHCAGGSCRPYNMCLELPQGQPCPYPYDLCVSYSYCSPYTITCAPVPSAFDPCNAVNYQCMGDLYCNFDRSPAVCDFRKDDDDSCVGDAECASGYCSPGGQLCATAPACLMP